MSLESLPNEVIIKISEYLVDKDNIILEETCSSYKDNIDNRAAQEYCKKTLPNIVHFSLVNRWIKNIIYEDERSILLKKADLIKKYSVLYSREVIKKTDSLYLTQEEVHNGVKTLFIQLFNALSIGSPFSILDSLENKDISKVEEDIQAIVKYIPQTLDCRLNTRVCLHQPPLVSACENPYISLTTIEFLLQQGANPNEKFINNTRRITILSRLISYKKKKAIQEYYTKEDLSHLDSVITLLKAHGAIEYSTLITDE